MSTRRYRPGEAECNGTAGPPHGRRRDMPMRRGGREKLRAVEASTFRPPALWAASPAHELDPEPVAGAYPARFVAWALRVLGAPRGRVLHACSGQLQPLAGAVRVDVRQAARPDVVADATALPFADGTFGAVLLDPPYSPEYASSLYGTEYPRPAHLLAEAARVVEPGGAIGFLHFLVPNPPPGTHIAGIYGVTTGCGYRIRAFTTFRRDPPGLFD